MKYLFIIALMLFAPLFLFGQDAIDHDGAHDHHHDHDHDHHRNEIGLANGAAYFINEKEFAYSMHMHYIHRIKTSKFGVGLGYERIFDEHKHNTLGVVGSYNPIGGWILNLSPGVTFEDEELSNINFAMHFETSYEFEWENYHIGPVLELAYDPEDYHISFGIHLGYGF